MRNLEVHIQASDETMDGVYESEFEDSWEGNPQLNDIDLASGQPPSNVQPIKMQLIIPLLSKLIKISTTIQPSRRPRKTTP